MRHIDANAFEPRGTPAALGVGEIHLWFFPHWEKTRVGAESPRVRAWLAAYLGREPEALRIDRGADGKPFLISESLAFNLSHSGDALMLAVGTDTDIGVDLERLERPRRADELARRWFHGSEADALGAVPRENRLNAFIGLWSCKEAVLKAQGTGIANGLHRAVFRMDDNGIVLGAAAESQVTGYDLVRFAPAPGLVGALAWSNGPRTVKCFRYAGPMYGTIDTNAQ